MKFYLSDIPIFVWVFFIICVVVFIFVYHKEIISVLFNKKPTYNNSKNINTGTNNGHVGDNYFPTQPKYSDYEKHIANLCIKVLNKMSLYHYSMPWVILESICNKDSEAVYSKLRELLNFYAEAGSNDIPTCLKKDINSAITKCKTIINA